MSTTLTTLRAALAFIGKFPPMDVAHLYTELQSLIATIEAQPVQEPVDDIPGLGTDESAFIRWAKKEKYDTSCHPMFFVMLDENTYAARMGWKAAKAHYAAPVQPVEQSVQEPVGQLCEDAFGRGQVMWNKKPPDGSMLYAAPVQPVEQPRSTP